MLHYLQVALHDLHHHDRQERGGKQKWKDDHSHSFGNALICIFGTVKKELLLSLPIYCLMCAPQLLVGCLENPIIVRCCFMRYT